MDASWEEGSSSSSLPIPRRPEYHVFVSFRGADTRKKFAGHLFTALEENYFHAFRDDRELERGEYISDGLQKAIMGSKMSLILFSKNYAESRWCLNELVKIMDCRKTLKQIVVPIFYKVEPSDVRKQTGVLEESFAKHLRKRSNGDVQKWRAALEEAGNLPGLTLSQANGDEAELIKMIIEDVRKNVNPNNLHVLKHPVGLEHRVRRLNELLNMESNCVRIVAIWGMSGIGKTTVAKALYDQIQHKFGWSDFLENVSGNGLDELKKKLRKALRETDFHGKTILLVLDDVDDDFQQLKALDIDRRSFAPGSRIIITTRNQSLQNKLKVDEMYELKALHMGESIELFSWHAFNEDHPPKDYLNLSWQIVYYAEGLPLALEVLGSYLYGMNISEWEGEIEKLRSIPKDDVQGKLKLSFDSLSEDVQELFLDMACFFIGTDRYFTLKILKCCKKFVEIGIRDLVNRCLIRYHLVDDKIMMHNVLRDMGRDIVKQKSLNDLGNRSRLWDPKDVLHVLRDGKGSEKVEGLLLPAANSQVNAQPFERMDILWYNENVFEVWGDGMGTEAIEGSDPKFTHSIDIQVNPNAFKKMDNLWLLHLDYFHLNAGYEQISRKLLWLSWKGFHLKFMPRNLPMEELVALDLRHSNLKNVWSEKKTLGQLKFLFLSHCRYLTRTPDFSGLTSLEELLLDDCKSLVEVDESIRYLNKLRVLDMKDCTNLQKLPYGIWMLKSLECLDLSGCSKLGNVAEFKGPPHKLWCSFFSSWKLPPLGLDSIGSSVIPVQASSCLMKLYLNGCHLPYLPAAIGNLMSLQTLDLGNNNLSTLPDHIFNLTCLKHLDLEDNNMSYLPSGIGRLTSLERLELSRNSLCTLPDTIGKLSHLKRLEVGYNKLSSLPCEIGDLESLETLGLLYNSIDTLPDRFCALTSLINLYLTGCKLSHLPSGMGRLVSLQSLSVRETNICTIPESLSDLPSLQVIWLDNCGNLQSLPKLPACNVSAESCASLESLPLELDQIRKSLHCPNSNRLAENFVSSILKQLPKSKGLYKLEDVVFICVPADGEIPILFPYGSRGSNVSFVVPFSVKQKMLGWILRLLFRGGVGIGSMICNKIEKELFFPGLPFSSYGQDTVHLFYIPQGHKGLQLQAGDEVEIPIAVYGVEAVVKSWAIDLIYEADGENRGDGIVNQVLSI